MIRQNDKIHLIDNEFFFFLLINSKLKINSGFLVRIRCFIFISKFQRIVNVAFSRTNSGLCLDHLVEGQI